jgi:mRNA interferase RelE/StbE
LGWRIELSRRAEKQLAAIDAPEALRIVRYLSELEKLESPRSRGKGLTADLAGLWRYRVGAWRVLCRIEDGRLLVLVVEFGQRRRCGTIMMSD